MLMLGPGLRQLHRPQQSFVATEEGPCGQGKRKIKFRIAGGPIYAVQYMYMSLSDALVQVACDIVQCNVAVESWRGVCIYIDDVDPSRGFRKGGSQQAQSQTGGNSVREERGA
jgi:hypothetical protein